MIEDINHLLETWGFGINYVVRQDNGKWLVTDEFFGTKNCMTKAERLPLTHITYSRKCRNAARNGEEILLAAALESGVELEAMVEMILHGAFAAARNDDDVLDPRSQSFFDTILNNGLVDERQHLLGYDLRGW